MNTISKTFNHILVLVISILIISPVFAGEIDPVLNSKLKDVSVMEKIPVIIYLKDQVDLDQMEEILKMSVAPGQRVPIDFRYKTIITALMNIAEETQPVILNRMEQYKTTGDLTDIQKFWIRNIIVAKATPNTIKEIAKWDDIGMIFYDGLLEYDRPVYSAPAKANPEASEVGLRAINAHKLWEIGITGQGRVVMNIDTGVFGNNLSFNTRWRGVIPGTRPGWAWFDPETNTTFPTDGDGTSNHGTHTMGTMCGLYASTNDTIGVAFNATWIAAKTINTSPHTSKSIAAFQWASNPDSNINTMNDVPDVISNSWRDPNTDATECQPTAGGYGPVFQSVEALGIAIVFSAGNSGPNASTITAPKNRASTGTDVFAVGSVNANTAGYPISSFSSRGPSKCTTVPDSLKIKPEVSAPGENVRSASGTSGFRTLSGTSMASPHVAGAIALLRQAAPFMTGTELKYLLMRTATDLGTAGEDNTYGWGIIDVWRAYQNLPLNSGFAKGVVTTEGNPLGGVLVDFENNVQQFPATTGANGLYKVMARVDTPQTSANYTIRAQKFGFVTYTDTITVVVGDTVTRNISLTRVNFPLITLSRSQIQFPTTPVYGTKRDSLTIKSEGGIALNINSVISTNPHFTVIPASAIIASGDSIKLYVTYTPLLDGSDTGRVIILSNANNAPRSDVILNGTGLGAPIFTSNVTILEKTLEGGSKDSLTFRVRNQGTALGNFAAAAVMYRRTNIAKEFSIPLTIKEEEKSRKVLLVIDNPGLLKGTFDNEKGPDTGPPVEGVSSSLIYRGLVEAGYFVDTVAFTTHNTSIYPNYDLVIWSAGANSSGTIFNDATKRAALTSRVLGGGKVWVEGGEVGYVFRKSGTTIDLDPPFRRIVLRDSNWISDVSTSNMVITQPSHAIFTTPNQINGPVAFSSTSIYARDAMRLQPNGGGIKIAGWSFYTTQGPDTAAFIISEGGGLPLTVFTPFAFGGITDTTVAKRLAQNIAVWLVGTGGRWLSVNPKSGSLVIGDSTTLVATFDATDSLIYNVPGNYYGRIQITATNSAIADSLNIPATLFVIPPASAQITVTPDNLNFGNVEIGADKTMSLLVRNIGGAVLYVTNINSSNNNFSVTPTSFSLAFDDTQRINVKFTPPFPPRTHNSTLSFTSNSSASPSIALTGKGIGVAKIAVVPDSLSFVMNPTSDTTYATFKIRNTGTDTLRYIIDEALASAKFTSSIERSITQQPFEEIPKGSSNPNVGPPMTDGRGGPDAGGYVWIDSDEAGGPTYNWFDISTVGTQLTGWVSSSGTANADDGYVKFRLPFSFRFYGVNYDSLKVVTNGWLSFDVVSTSTALTNGAIPITAEPNNALYPWWDDLDLRTSGTVHSYLDAVNNRFLIQYTNVPAYVSSGPPPGVYTFQIILKANGDIIYQFKDMQGILNSATIGIENSAGTIALQVANNQAYMKNNLAILFTRDLLSWVSVPNNMGSIVPGDSQSVQVRIHPAGLSTGLYNGRLVISGNSPDVKQIGLRLQVVPTPDFTLNLTAMIEGFIRNSTTMIADNVTVELRNAGTPYGLVESKTVALNASGVGTGNFTLAQNGVPYYIVIKHRNSIETWSGTTQTFTGGTLNYNFTTAASQSYGDNMQFKFDHWCIFSGDVNQSGSVDLTDVATVDVDNNNFVTGYVVTDITGDNLVDIADLAITDVNNNNFVSVNQPSTIKSKKVKQDEEKIERE